MRNRNTETPVLQSAQASEIYNNRARLRKYPREVLDIWTCKAEESVERLNEEHFTLQVLHGFLRRLILSFVRSDSQTRKKNMKIIKHC